MNKIVSILLLSGLVLTSCQQEEVGSYVDSTEFKAKIKLNETESDSNSDSDGCETAFGRYCECASQNTCFSDFDGISRWGWSVNLSSYRTYRFNLFAGAGQCELDKGEYAGYVYVTFNSDGTVTFGNIVMESGFNLIESHFYAGDTEVPMKNGKMTVAPGQYYNEGDKDGDGTAYVIVHTSVCKDQD